MSSSKLLLDRPQQRLTLCRSCGTLRTVIDGDCVHLFGRQLRRNCAHLLVDVVLPHALGESRELAFDVGGMLALQRRGSELMGARAVTGCAGRDPASGIAGKDQANRRIALPQAAPALGERLRRLPAAARPHDRQNRPPRRPSPDASARVAIALMTPQRRLPER